MLCTLLSDGVASLILSRESASSTDYGRFYISQQFLDATLQFLVLVELTWSVLSPVRKSLPRGAIFVLGILIGLAGLAAWPLARMALPQSLAGSNVLNILLFQLQETVNILRVVIFLAIASFSQLLSIGWRDRELQMATGLGFFSIVSLIVSMFHSHQGLGESYHWVDQGLNVCYLGTLSYWAISIATKEQERKEFSPQMQQLLLLMGGGVRAGRFALSDLPSDRKRKRD